LNENSQTVELTSRSISVVENIKDTQTMDTEYTMQTYVYYTSETANCLGQSYSVLNYGWREQIPRAGAQYSEFSFDSLSVSRAWTVTSRKHFVHKVYSVFSNHRRQEEKLRI